MSVLRRLLGSLWHWPNRPHRPAAGAQPPDLEAAHALLSQGRCLEAARAYESILALDPANVMALNGYAVASNHQEEFEAAESALRKALAAAPRDAGTLANLAITLLRQQRLDEAEHTAQSALSRDPASAEGHFVLAETLQRRGQLDEADRHYAKSAQYDSQLFAVCSNVRLATPFFSMLESQVPASPPLAYPMARCSPERYDHVVLVSCDQAYFERYGGSFIRSFAEHASHRSLLHVHFISDDGALVERLDKTCTRLGLQAFQCSSAALPPDLARGSRSTYYASARFLYMREWLNRYAKPLACFDIDAVLRASVEPLLESARDADLGLAQRKAPYSPWTQILAWTLVVNPTPQAEGYFGQVARYLQYFFAENRAQWSLDQIALYCVLRRWQAQGTPLKIAPIYETAEATAWQLTRALGDKAKDALYAQYRLEV